MSRPIIALLLSLGALACDTQRIMPTHKILLECVLSRTRDPYITCETLEAVHRDRGLFEHINWECEHGAGPLAIWPITEPDHGAAVCDCRWNWPIPSAYSIMTEPPFDGGSWCP